MSSSTLTRREQAITMKGNPLNLLGDALEVGQTVPGFTLIRNDLSPATLQDFSGTTILLSTVPSLDTGVCDLQARRFNDEAAGLESTSILIVSMDLPFAQARWCGNSNAENITTLSDYQTAEFGANYGLLIENLRLLARAVLVIDPDNTLKYQEVVPELTEHPNYDAALAALKR